MKISELIKQLQAVEKEHGDLTIMHYSAVGVRPLPEISVMHLRILSKKESRQYYWHDWRSNDTPENKGEKVLHI